MSVTRDTGPCCCSICRGATKIPATGTRPSVYPHEIQIPAKEAPAEVLPSPSVAFERKAKVKIATPVMSVEEKIAFINSRTDIGAALKKMQISNILRKLKQ